MEENREQPIIMPAPALEKATENEVMSEVGSQEEAELGKFKSVQALMDAYNSLQSEFTKKCQLLKSYEKDKTDDSCKEKKIEKQEDEMVGSAPQEKEEVSDEEVINLFLSHNEEAKGYANEIKERFGLLEPTQKSPRVAWADVILSHLKEGDKTSDPIINQYVLSDENVRNKIIEKYLIDLSNQKPPITITSRSGDRVSGVKPDTPKTLAEAKRLVDKMFS